MLSTRVCIEHPDLALTHSINAISGADFGVVSDAGTDPQHDGHFFWIEAPDFTDVEAALEEDHTVGTFTPIVTQTQRRIYHIEYSEEAMLLTPAITDLGGLTLESKSSANGWILTIELLGRDDLYELKAFAIENEMQFDILELRQTTATTDPLQYGLTEPQIEALASAYTSGYYDETRQISLEELGAQLDISQTAVSGRLRRGSARLIEALLLNDEG